MKHKKWQDIEFKLIQYPILFHLMSLDDVEDKWDELIRLSRNRKVIPSGQATLTLNEVECLEKIILLEYKDTFKGEELVYPNLIIIEKKDLINGIVSLKVVKRTVEIYEVTIPVTCNIELKVFGESVKVEKKHPQKALQWVQDMLNASLNKRFFLGRWKTGKIHPYSQEYQALAKLVCSFRVANDSLFGSVRKTNAFLIRYAQETIQDTRFEKYCELLGCEWKGEFAYRLVTAYWWYLREQKNRNTLQNFVCGFKSFCKNHIYEDADWYRVANNGLEFNSMLFDQNPIASINKHETDWSVTDENIIEPSLEPGPSSDDDDGDFREDCFSPIFPTMEDFWVKFVKDLEDF